MNTLTAGSTEYWIATEERGGRWIARAARADTGDRFGVECDGPTEPDAIERLSRWLEWQYEHTVALEALQRAEHALHRTIAGSAFAGSSDGTQTAELRKASLEQVDAARARLDEVRARRPE